MVAPVGILSRRHTAPVCTVRQLCVSYFIVMNALNIIIKITKYKICFTLVLRKCVDKVW